MTRLAREIPTDPTHPIKENGTDKDKHTPLTRITENKRKRKFSPLKYNIPMKTLKKNNPEAL
jgi:hypothetical protein